jgi:hypothetical protein
MQKCINGWTKEKMLKVIKARPFEKASFNDDIDTCLYLNEDGNKCAVGLFIPDGHKGEDFSGDSDRLLRKYPELKKYMPLGHMREFQKVHDKNLLRAKTKMIEWVMENVED